MPGPAICIEMTSRLELRGTMDSLALLVSILYQFATNVAFLLLCALGLIVILGMMNIINLAHGELMMLGAYTATVGVDRGVPFPLAVVLAFIVVGAVRRRARAASRPPLLRPRARRTRRHLGHQPDSEPGRPAAAWARSCRRSRYPAARSRSANIRSRSTGWC